jgi:hypothetical protein
LGNVFALSPTVSFNWPDDKNDKNAKPTLVVQWCHIGDEKAHGYVLYLNDKKIYHVYLFTKELSSSTYLYRLDKSSTDK